MRIFRYVEICILLICGCSEPETSEQKNKQFIISQPDTLQATSPDTSGIIESGDNLIVKGPCAVFYGPDSATILEKKKEMPEEDFLTIVDDNLYYLSQARNFLESHGVKTINTTKRKLVFVRKDMKKIMFDTYTTDLDWELVLFDGINDPVKIDMVDIEDEYPKYFRKK